MKKYYNLIFWLTVLQSDMEKQQRSKLYFLCNSCVLCHILSRKTSFLDGYIYIYILLFDDTVQCKYIPVLQHDICLHVKYNENIIIYECQECLIAIVFLQDQTNNIINTRGVKKYWLTLFSWIETQIYGTYISVIMKHDSRLTGFKMHSLLLCP